MSDNQKQPKNWIPSPFQSAARDLAKDAIKKFVDEKIIKL